MPENAQTTYCTIALISHASKVMLKILQARLQQYVNLMAESEEELKSLLMKVKVESDKVGLKFNIQKTKIMASGPITSWEIDGETVETVSDFIFLGSKITADGDCSHEIKRRLLLGRKVMTNLDSILKSRVNVKIPAENIYVFGCLRLWQLSRLFHLVNIY